VPARPRTPPPAAPAREEREARVGLQVEVEIKLVADGAFPREAIHALLDGAGAVRAEAATREQTDVYLDTRSRSLARAGLSARHRVVVPGDPGGVLQVKPVLLDPGLVAVRVELETRLSPGESPPRALRRFVESRFPIRLRGDPVPLVELRASREKSEVVLAGGTRAELSLDRVEARRSADGGVAAFLEVELELRGGPPEPLLALGGGLAALPGLSPSGRSKLRRATELLGIEEPALVPALPALSLVAPTDEVARAVCGHHLESLVSREPAVRVGLDTEAVHKMRVSTRRLRASLRLFGACFAAREASALLASFRWLARALGEVRDLDVQLLQLRARRERLGAQPSRGWEELARLLQARHEAARGRLLAILDGAKYAALVARAGRVFGAAPPRRRPGHPAALPAIEFAGRTLSRRSRKLARAIEEGRTSATPERLHAIRIRGKRYRYAGEAFQSLFNEAFGERLSRLSRFQEVLGLFQDGVVSGRLSAELQGELLASGRAGSTPELLCVLGKLEAASRIQTEAAATELDRALEVAGGSKSLSGLAKQARKRARDVRTLLGAGARSEASAGHEDPAGDRVPADKEGGEADEDLSAQARNRRGAGRRGGRPGAGAREEGGRPVQEGRPSARAASRRPRPRPRQSVP
jgi:triphosphatase